MHRFFGLVLCLAAFSAAAQPATLPAARCNESVFKPCVCSAAVPEDIKYRPRLRQCGGNAAAILEGEYARSFSVVLRDRLNRDRYPAVGFNGCNTAAAALGLAKCSAYKCQKVIRNPGQTICCFGDSGDSAVLSKATRLTIKLRDVPNASTDPLARICLNGFSANKKLN